MAERACVKRLQKEYHALCKEPVPQVVARPFPGDILEWHYVLEGSQETPFAGGYYYGKIKFPPEYPYKPPSISMTTPNGRFAPHKKICLSMSDFHPETWNPIWSVSSILTGLLSFMCGLDRIYMRHVATGHYLLRPVILMPSSCPACSCKNCPNFKKLFPEYVEKYEQLQAPERSISEQPTSREQSSPPVTTLEEAKGLEGTDMVILNNARNRRQCKKVPFWLLMVLVSVFGVVMALPLLQL